MVKNCTSIEQSKKLAEILPIESADMCYSYYGNPKYNPTIAYEGEQWFLCQIRNSSHDIPCWSLPALLGLIKSEIYGETIYGDTVTYKVKFRKYKFTDDIDLYQIAYGSIKFDVDGRHSFKDMVNTGEKENLIDAAFEMVVWLKENKKI